MSAGRHLNDALAAEAEAYRALLAGDDAGPALARARDAYLASHADTGPRSWGRLLGALKMAILAGDGVDAIARQAVAEAAEADSPASAYARALAQVALGRVPDVGVMLAEGDSFTVQAFRHGTGYALQFHPEVTHAMMYRWLTRGAHRMELPGTKQRHEHIADRAVHDYASINWLSNFIDHWIAQSADA